MVQLKLLCRAQAHEQIRGPFIYRRGAHPSQILFWAYELLGPKYRSLSGVEGGVTEYSAWTTAFAKNEGKRNERSAEEQAESVAKSHMAKKLKMGGYHLKRADIDKKSAFFRVMLADKYVPKSLEGVKVRIQPKFNGMRCVVTRFGMFSRYGEPITSAPHIFASLKHHFVKEPELVFDGELYNHNLKELLNKLLSLVKKKNPKAEELEESKRIVEFHTYDLYDGDNADMVDTERFMKLAKLIYQLPFIVLAKTNTAIGHKEIKQWYEDYLGQGYEGLIIRLPGAYMHKRTPLLLKYKPRDSAEFKIARVNSGKGKRENMAATVTCYLPKNKGTGNPETFEANVKNTDEFKIQIWKEKESYPNTWATVSFSYYTDKGVPFHNYLELLHADKKRKF